MTVSWALGGGRRCGPGDGMGRWRHRLEEDDSAMNLGTVWVDGVAGSGRTMTLWALGRCGSMAS
jgi:hypothetical protein